MTLRRAVPLTLVVALTIAATLPAQSELNDPKAFWERMIAAKGGRERLHAIDGLVLHVDGREERRSEPWRPLGDVHETWVYQFPDRFWIWKDTRPSRPDAFLVIMWNGPTRLSWFAEGGQAARRSQYAPTEDSNDTMLSEAQLWYLLETRFVRPTPSEIERDRSGKTAVLRATAPRFATIRYTVDLETYLVREVRVTPPPLGTRSEGRSLAADSPSYGLAFDGYETVDGIKMPMRYTGSHRLTWEFNPKLNPALFETAPDGVKSRDAWKKYLRK